MRFDLYGIISCMGYLRKLFPGSHDWIIINTQK